MAEGDEFERRLLVSVDAKGYSSSTAHWQGRLQAALLTVLDRAAERAGLSRATWKVQGAGDGELAVLPPGEPEPRVVDDFPRHLAAELRRHNRDVPEGKHLRLRLAVHFGPAIIAGNGFAGRGPIDVRRLCDCEAVRTALDSSGAALAVILSQRVFSETVAQEHTSLEPAMFRKVTVRVKEFADEAWVWVPGHDIGDLRIPDAQMDTGPPPEVPPAAAPRREPPSQGAHEIHGNFAHADVRARKVVGGDEINYHEVRRQ
ncbi:hypothetical protein [Planomonospora venezuelensis]|uniref:Guanylate cyclase domain-containing protein n=1 Tax=Planomonospora venezuelensis TaxID=1999 RepID=A0A841D7W5_PLAVE|nr:hypothetical protein [Planomonospora venezuelensis]MBB5966030.1 hypothetical protein [Planomonospora venezuelensis]GIN05696.1 hypothetical protein Pve01_73540 [Planomonospora venezuelensis]